MNKKYTCPLCGGDVRGQPQPGRRITLHTRENCALARLRNLAGLAAEALPYVHHHWYAPAGGDAASKLWRDIQAAIEKAKK